MSEEWIGACDAYKMVFPGQKIMGGPNAIIRRAESGAVRARASLLVKPGAGEGEKNFQLPKEFWGGWSMIPDWVHGDFSSKFQLRGRDEYWKAIGVTFEPISIEALARSAKNSAAESHLAAKVQNSAPRREKKHDWEGALIHVIAWANSPDGLPTGYGAQAKIERSMACWFQKVYKREPAPSELRKYAKRILNEIELLKPSAESAGK